MTALAGLISQKTLAQQDVARHLAMSLLNNSTRGHDDRGAFVAGPCAMAIWSRRTLDLTPDGAQLFTAEGFTVALDGYIANAGLLRRELEDSHQTRFRGHGDAELIAFGARAFGLNRLLQKLEGAFTFALWDAENAALHLVRDRMGARPVYVTSADGVIAFASDMTAFAGLPGFISKMDPKAAASYLAWGHNPAPRALWDGVICLPPGHRMMIAADTQTLPKPEEYWSPATAIEESALRANHDSGRLERLIAALSTEATRLDVPFALLDDSIRPNFQLRSNLDRASDKPYKTWTISPPDGAALQTAYDALSQLPEPVSDPLAISWYIACKNAAKDSVVALAATGLDIPAPDTGHDRKWRKALNAVPGFLRPLLPAKAARFTGNAEKTYLARLRQWDIDAPEPEIIEPRIDANLDRRTAFFECADQMRNAFIPGLDRIANAAGVELRLPMTDARVLDFGLPVVTPDGISDIATWLRGPLRPRVESHLNAANLARLGLDDAQPYLDAWKTFLTGDNTQSRPLWTLATLLAWSTRH